MTGKARAGAEQRAARDEKIRHLWSQGLSRSLIAERLGIARDTVSTALRRLGLTSNKDKRV